MGRLRFELRTSRLKAGCSTAELATLLPRWQERSYHATYLEIKYPIEQINFVGSSTHNYLSN